MPIKRRHQHQQISLKHFRHQFILDRVFEDAIAVHMAMVATFAWVNVFIGGVENKNVVTFGGGAVDKALSQKF